MDFRALGKGLIRVHRQTLGGRAQSAGRRSPRPGALGTIRRRSTLHLVNTDILRTSFSPFIAGNIFLHHLGYDAEAGRRGKNISFRCMPSDLPSDGRVHLDSLSRPVSRRPFVALLLVAGLITIVPLAHGSPPDPTWIAGLYDDADHDDAVLGRSVTPADCRQPME